MRAVAVDGHTPHMASLAVIVVERKVLNSTVIPKCDSAWCPTEAAGELFLRAMIKQEVQKRTAFAAGHVFEIHGEGHVHVKRFASGFRMGADDGMLKFRHVVIGIVYVH